MAPSKTQLWEALIPQAFPSFNPCNIPVLQEEADSSQQRMNPVLPSPVNFAIPTLLSPCPAFHDISALLSQQFGVSDLVFERDISRSKELSGSTWHHSLTSLPRLCREGRWSPGEGKCLRGEKGWGKGTTFACGSTWSSLGRWKNVSLHSRAKSFPGLLCIVFAQRFKWQQKAFPPKPVVGLDFCSPPPALMLTVSPGWLKLFGDAIEQVWHLGSPRPH